MKKRYFYNFKFAIKILTKNLNGYFKELKLKKYLNGKKQQHFDSQLLKIGKNIP